MSPLGLRAQLALWYGGVLLAVLLCFGALSYAALRWTLMSDVDTTLLIHPTLLADFLDFNDFMQMAEAAVGEHGLDGVIQIASFHPRFQFEGTDPDDIGNYTNRAPFPTLHLLREASIERAVAAFPEAESIYERNIETLEELGHAGWDALWRKPEA